MTTNREPQDQAPGADPVGPGDVPAERPLSLDRLDALTGQWDMEATFEAGSFGPGSPAMTARGGRTTFAWLEGRFFLTQRFITEHPAAPSGIAIIGAGTEPDTFTQHYYDSRGVARVYQMTLDGGVWKLWREAPGFWQRYTGQISGDGNTITGAWEGSARVVSGSPPAASGRTAGELYLAHPRRFAGDRGCVAEAGMCCRCQCSGPHPSSSNRYRTNRGNPAAFSTALRRGPAILP